MYESKRFSRRGVLGAAAVLALSVLSACSTVAPGVRTPAAYRPYTTVLGLPNGRFFVDDPKPMMAEQALSIEREARALGIPKGGALPAISMLSLSGGGDDGAFGSGLLVGWTAHGDRPQFKLVTGVSTGALIAPFAFLERLMTAPWPRSTPTSSPRKSSWRALSFWRR